MAKTTMQQIWRLACSSVLLAASGIAAADDTDLFLQDPTASTSKPNILFILDNSANWNSNLGSYTKKNIIHEALYSVLTNAANTDRFRAGIMTFASGDGGKVIMAVDDLTTSYQTELGDTIYGGTKWSAGMTPTTCKSNGGDTVVPTTWNGHYYSCVASGTTDGTTEPTWPTDGSTVVDGTVTWKDEGSVYGTDIELLESYNNAPYALSMYEAYRYFMGLAPEYGTADGDHDTDALSSGVYKSPALEAGMTCSNNFIVWIGSGAPDNAENNTAETKITSLGAKLSTDPIDLNPDNDEANWADEFARFMKGVDVDPDSGDIQNIRTYVVDVVDLDTVNTKPERAARAFLNSIANQGDGRYFTADNASDLTSVITEVLDEIIAVNSVFASTTLPVSVNVRGTHLNQVYMGVFRPDSGAYPRWLGNLKLYQLAYDNSTESVYLADTTGQKIQSPTTGFVVEDAISFWTEDSTYWSWHSDYADAPSDKPDGDKVEKGAVAQKLRDSTVVTPATRTLYTCISCSGALSGQLFNTSNSSITQAMLGAASSTERDNIINWSRGYDLNDENGDSSTTDMRASVHGDVLHSRPAVVNYNRNGDDNDIVVFYGSNDGMFRAVEGGKAASGTSTPGKELWGFIPEEHLDQLKRLYDNDVKTYSSDNTVTTLPKPYFIDGTIGVYQKDANSDGKYTTAGGDDVHLFLSMRRGGDFIYALDVTDPSAPSLLWKKSSSDTGWGEVGQTWSEPKVATILYGGSPKTVLIMGAGYDDTSEDVEPSTTNTKGRGVLIIDAANGNVLWQAGPSPSGATYNVTVSGMVHSIPADITLVDANLDANGYTDLLYAADTGGNIWRIDISDASTSNWSVRLMAQLGDHTTAAGRRKFLYAPDVVFANGYKAILIGSGDREHPFNKTTVNRFYMIKDTGPADDWPITESDLYDATNNAIQDGADQQTKTDALSDLAAAQGWYITLGTGEKVVGNAITIAGSTFFNTNQPSTDAGGTSCTSDLGTARNYIVSYEDATATTEQDSEEGLSKSDRARTAGTGYPPSPVPFVVELDDGDGGKKLTNCTISGAGTNCGSGSDPQRRYRKFWYIMGDE